MILDGKAKPSDDQLVEFNMFIDVDNRVRKLATLGNSKANVPRLMRFNPAITILEMKK